MANFLVCLILLSPMPAEASRIKQSNRLKSTAQVDSIEHSSAPLVSDEKAEDIFRNENNKCQSRFKFGLGKCLPGRDNPFNPSVSMCEKRALSHDNFGEKCRISQAWMLHGDESKDAAWWADLQLHILDVKMGKFEKRCTGPRPYYLDWIMGKCKRRAEHVIQALTILSKVIHGQVFRPIPQEKLEQIHRGLEKSKGKIVAFIASSDQFKDVKDRVPGMFQRFTTIIDEQPKPLMKKAKDQLYSILNALLQQDFGRAEQLLAEFEKSTDEGFDLDHELGEEDIQEPGLESMLMDIEVDVNTKIDNITEEMKSQNFTDAGNSSGSLLEMRVACRDGGGAGGVVLLVCMFLFWMWVFGILR